MEPRIQTLGEKKLIGQRLTMSLANNRTGELWGSFMPRRREINNTIGTELYSLQVYDPFYFESFSPAKEFQKWAAVAVSSFNIVPDGMETLTLAGGIYAVFPYKGLSNDPAIFQYIFTTWLPQSGYALDNRPHFELLGAKYKNNDPHSEEEIWIPVKEKH